MRNTTHGAKPEKAMPKRKAAGGCNPTATIKKHIANIAPGCEKRHTALKCCDTLQATPELLGLVLENTVIDSGAFTHALSWVFSRPNTLVYGRDGLVRKAGRMAESMFSTSRPPVALEKAASGFQSHSGAEAMTNVNTTITPTSGQSIDAIARHQHVSNAISTAQWHLAHGRINEATGRIMSAARHLKQLCTESTIGGRA
ncbi:MAG: hypothetical protein Q7J75_02215 [Rhodoferax sp.]|nr:hypothetical protein [Rhodoferax sp.]